MKVKGDSGIEFALADEVATAMITAGILQEASRDGAPAEGEDAGQESQKRPKK